MDNFNQIDVENLLINLKKFYKRFYIRKLSFGIFWSFGLLLLFITLIDTVTFYFNPSSKMRLFMLVMTVFLFGYLLFIGVLVPLSRLLKRDWGISNTKAALIIGKFFPEINDKLLNTLHLKSTSVPNELVFADLALRSKQLAKYNFEDAVAPLDKRKIGLFFAIPFLLFTTILFWNSKIFELGTKRILNYDKEIAVSRPFDFHLLSENLQVIRNGSLKIEMEMVGESLPENASIVFNNVTYRLNKTSNVFGFLAENIVEDSEFYFESLGYKSKRYSVMVREEPSDINMVYEVIYPAYLNMLPQVFTNSKYLDIPEGSKIKGNFNGKHIKNIAVTGFDSVNYVNNRFNGLCNVNSKLNFVVGYSDLLDIKSDTLKYEITPIRDQFPWVRLSYDSLSSNKNGKLYWYEYGDDYGINNLELIIENQGVVERTPLKYGKTGGNGEAFVDLSNFEGPVKVWVEITDNDAPHHYKKGKSDFVLVNIKNHEEIRKDQQSDFNKLLEDLEFAAKKRELLNKDADKIRKELLDKKSISWEDKEKVDNLLENSKSNMEDLKELDKRINEFNKSSNTSEEILEKQEQLKSLMDKVLSEEDLELLQEIEDLLKKLDKSALEDHLKSMSDNQEKMREELEQNLEIFKELNFERELEETLQRLEKIREKEEELKESEESVEKQSSIQDSLLNEFEKFMEDSKRIDSLNKDLEQPIDLEFQEELMKSSEAKMKELKNSLGNEKDSKKEKEAAAEELKKLEESLKEQLEMASSSQEGEDLNALRTILENLLVVSYEQENISELLEVNIYGDKDVNAVLNKQEVLKLKMGIISDTLKALVKRNPQIDAVVMKELDAISYNMNEGLGILMSGESKNEYLFQRKSLTSINNLAVLLDEIIQQMEKKEGQKDGEGSCDKPGAGKPKPGVGKAKGDMKKLQQQMEKLKKELEKGNQPGKMNPGNIGEGMSGELAKIAATQDKIRQQLRELSKELEGEGNMGAAGSLKQLSELLKQQQEDVINMNFDEAFFERQKSIEVKMLEAEQAIEERDRDNKRKSSQGGLLQESGESPGNKKILLEERELFQEQDLDLNDYYKKLKILIK